MKTIGRIVLLACITVLAVSCGGVSQKDMDIMRASLGMKLFCAYDAAGVKCEDQFHVELNKVKQKAYCGIGDYWGVYTATFNDGTHDVFISGVACFDVGKSIAIEKVNGVDKDAISIRYMSIDNQQPYTTTSEMPKKYLLDSFMNSTE